jgi:endonuclease YncB( thermonuclease family)
MSTHILAKGSGDEKGFMKTHFWSGQKRNLVGFALAAVMGAAGCNVIKPPEPEPTPTPATKPTKPVFTPTDYVTHWPEGKRPGLFRISNVINGDTVQIQSVSVVNTAPTPTPLPEGAPLPPGGAPTPAAGGIAPGQKVTFGVPETVRLAGIVAPSAGQPGYQGSVNTVFLTSKWKTTRSTSSMKTVIATCRFFSRAAPKRPKTPSIC